MRVGTADPYAPLVEPVDRSELIRRMVEGGGSRAESFFLVRGLGAAFDSPGKGWGTQKKVNAALLAAERAGTLDQVLEDAAAEYGLPSRREGTVVPPRTLATKSSRELPGAPKGRVFISHAAVDKPLADALADLLRLGTDLTAARILCTSLEGMGVPEGVSDYLDYLRTTLNGAELVVPLLTPAFFDSEVCLIELGAMWGAQLPSFPIVVEPVDYGRVEQVLGKMQLSKIDDAKHLARLHDAIVTKFGLKARTDMWEAKRDQFLAKLPNIIAGLKPASRVATEVHQATLKKVKSLQQQVKTLTVEKSALEAKVASIAAAKTDSEVRAALVPDDELEQFQELVAEAKDAVLPLSNIVRRALYETIGRGEPMRLDPGSYEMDDAEDALRDDQLRWDDDTGGYWINRDDPQVESAAAALTALFAEQWSDSVEEWFKTTYKKALNAASRQAWVSLGLLR